MLHEIGENRFDNQWKSVEPNEEDFVLIYKDDQVLLLGTENDFQIPKYKDIKRINENIEIKGEYIFSIDNKPYFTGNYPNLEVGEELFYERIYKIGNLEPMDIAFAVVTGKQLSNYIEGNKFCGKCGKPMEKSETERAFICRECNITNYPKIAPAVIVGVTKGEEILMTRYARGNYKKYALIAGFCEVGESVEETILREVYEEVGLRVKNPKYFKSQPWPFSESMLMGFFVELDGDDTVTLDEEELAESKWFKREDVPVAESNISLTSQMTEAFRLGEV